MELDELKDNWDKMNAPATTKQNINLSNINKMSKAKFNSKLYRIILPEVAGSIVCIGSAIFIVIYFGRLDKPVYQAAGILGILLLLILPVISLMSIKSLSPVRNPGRPYIETLQEFAKQKIHFCKLQKLNITLSYLLLVTVVLLSTRLFGRNTLTDSKYFFVFAFTFGYCFLLVFSKLVFKSYNKIISQTEDMLKEMVG